MKKSLIALAALATVATAAQAQSSVTVYGIVDAGVVRASGLASNLSATTLTAPLATNRLGFRGTEDLGSGLSANFNLETGFNADNGSQSANTPLFNRQSWVGLAKAGVGQIQAGRTTRLDFDALIAGDAFGAANFGGVHGGGVTAVILGDNNSSTDADATRAVNAIKVTSATISGVTVAYQHGFGEQDGDASKLRQQGYSLDYTAGKAKITYASQRMNNSSGVKTFENRILTGSYDFGFAKVFAGYAEKEINTTTVEAKAQYIGAQVPVNANTRVVAQISKLENQSNTANYDADSYSVGVLYDFTKRTTGYLMAAQISNDPGATVSIRSAGTAGAGLDHKAYTVGIRHSF